MKNVKSRLTCASNAIAKSDPMNNSFFQNSTMIFLSLLCFVSVYDAEASTSFSEQFINAGTDVFFPDDYFHYDSEALNLEGVYYKSDGETLDTRLIVSGKTGFSINNTISYGMLIDSDSDFNTGRNGFDYRYMVQWDNGTMNEIYEQFLTNSSEVREIFKKPIGSFFVEDSVEHNSLKNTVEMSIDLEKIGNPELYAVVFFSEGYLSGKTPLVQDVTRLAIIPPPEFVVTTEPSLISFPSGTEKIIHIQVDSDIAETTDLHYNVYLKNKNENIVVKQLLIENFVELSGGKAVIPVSLEVEGHDDSLTHKLQFDLEAWYDVNPYTKTVERGGELFDSYYFRNQQEPESFTIFWSTLEQKPSIGFPLLIQIILLGATIVMAYVGVKTHRNNKKMGDSERKLNHSTDMAKIFKTILSLVCIRDYYSKELTLRYPEDEIIQEKVRSGINIRNFGDIVLRDLVPNNIPRLSWALQHIESYHDIKNSWNKLQRSKSKYKTKVHLVKQQIEIICENGIKEKLPDLRAYDGSYSDSYFIENIVFEVYEILVDHVNGLDHQPIQTSTMPWNLDSNSDKRKLYMITSDSILFQTTQPIDYSIVTKILNSCITEETTLLMNEIIQEFNNTEQVLAEFKKELKEIVIQLEGHDLIEGKCELGI